MHRTKYSMNKEEIEQEILKYATKEVAEYNPAIVSYKLKDSYRRVNRQKFAGRGWEITSESKIKKIK